jgi:hypothetical protein
MVIKNGQSWETGNTGHTRQRQTKQKHNICDFVDFAMNQN